MNKKIKNRKTGILLAFLFIFVLLNIIFGSASDIDIINKQSYPKVGGNWDVEFETKGKSDLVIEAVDGTYFGKDLEFLGVQCRTENINYEIEGNKIFIKDYECENGKITSRVLTPGKHVLKFSFSGKEVFAYNQANLNDFNVSITSTQPTINDTLGNITWSFQVPSASRIFNNTCNIYQTLNGITIPFLLGSWSFNVNGTDCSGFGLHTTLQGSAAISGISNGSIGQGLVLNGSGKANTTSDLTTYDFAIEFNFKPNMTYDNSTGLTSTLAYKRDDYELMIENGSFVFSYRGNNLSSKTVNWSNDQWHHVAVTFDGQTQRIYVNGLLESEYLVEAYAIKNSTGNNVGLFTNNGHLIVRGNCISRTTCDLPDAALVFQNSSGTNLAYIGGDGTLCTVDSCSGNDAGCDNPNDGSFIVRGINGDNVAYIDGNGTLCLRGNLVTNGNP